MLKKVKTKKWW